MQSQQNIIIYKTKDSPELSVKLEEETIWLTLNQIAILFDLQKAAISKHTSNIFKSGELERTWTVSKMETVQVEGNRKIKRTLTYFNLDVIIAVGYLIKKSFIAQLKKKQQTYSN